MRSFSSLRGRAAAAVFSVLLLPSLAHAQCVANEIDVLYPTSGGMMHSYGCAVAASDDWLAVGAYVASGFDGRVYLYDRNNGMQMEMLDPPAGAGGGFGRALALGGNFLVIGEPHYDLNRGRVTIMKHDGVMWTKTQTLVGPGPGDQYGMSVSLDIAAGRMVIGYPKPATRGGIHIFEWDGATWVAQRKLSTWGFSGAECGSAVSVSGGVVVAGAPFDAGGGKVYVWEGSGLAWNMVATLSSPTGAQFGHSVAVQGSELFVGSPDDDVFGTDNGAVYRYTQGPGTWTPAGMLGPTEDGNEVGFGYSLDVDGDALVAGSPGEDSFGAEHGAVTQFRRQGITWVPQQILLESGVPVNDNYGEVVTVHRGSVFAGAITNNVAGATFVFDVPDLSLSVTPTNPNPGDAIKSRTCGGAPGNLMGLFVTSVDGSPIFLPILFNFFDAEGEHYISALHNDPALYGIDLELMSLGVDALGKARWSQVQALHL